MVGNPPYIRGDWLTKFKHHFKAHYATFHSTADIYVYFYELGFNLLSQEVASPSWSRISG